MPQGSQQDSKRTIAMVAHDRMKPVLVEWAEKHKELLKPYRIITTGTTGRILGERLPDLDITPFKSGPLGGDMQIGALISEGKLDAMIFLVDPMTPQPHDVDVKALIRISTLYETPMACNRTTADCIIAKLADPDFQKEKRLPNPLIDEYAKRSV